VAFVERYHAQHRSSSRCFGTFSPKTPAAASTPQGSLAKARADMTKAGVKRIKSDDIAD